MNNIKDKEYKIALAQVDDILFFTDNKIVSQIPMDFLNYIKNNKEQDYISNINPYLSLEEQDILDETKALISLIYRSYIADKNELLEFEEQDRIKIIEEENKKREKYNPDKIFKKEIQDVRENNLEELEKIKKDLEQKAIAIVKQDFISKICNKVKSIFFKIIKRK